MGKIEARRRWDREELILAFNLYCRTPFGRLHSQNPDIIALAQLIDRTPSSVAMKLNNFASLDPAHQQRQIKGLSNASKGDKAIWDEFHTNWFDLAYESEVIYESLREIPHTETPEGIEFIGEAKTERETTGKIRLVQKFFRETVLSSYSFRCAVCGLDLPEFLIASHIIPWSVNDKRRADPTNGLSLCVSHDRAFDRGYMGIDQNYTVSLSSKLSGLSDHPSINFIFTQYNGREILKPDRFLPDKVALIFHWNNIFQK